VIGRSDDARPSSRLRRIAFFLVALALLSGNIAAIVVPFEVYPFTSAPMFAHPPAGAGTRYVVDLRLLALPNQEHAFPYDALGFSEAHFQRTLLVRAYGSSDADAPYGYVPEDDDDKRAARLQRFFTIVVDALRERGALPPAAGAVRLSLRAVDREAQAREIGTYRIASGMFERPDDAR
jgi:hypothetical protein